ncbi:hypothetical protein OV320_1848 [Actinobacteria bacterium OV320]|nr:hypothetical protein OV320_1848 [Actinobacteria bacterium OV320]
MTAEHHPGHSARTPPRHDPVAPDLLRIPRFQRLERLPAPPPAPVEGLDVPPGVPADVRQDRQGLYRGVGLSDQPRATAMAPASLSPAS